MFEEILLSTDFATLSIKDFFLRLLVTLGIGLLTGIEREHSAIKDNAHMFAGVRTFTLVTLLGFLAGILSALMGFGVIYLSFTGVLIIVMISYYVSSSSGELGSTTEFTLIISFLLGLLTFLGHIQISLIISIIMVTLLSLKMQMKTIVGKITQDEIYAVLKFVILVALVLPFLPDKTIDPYNVFNPRDIMLVIILTSGLNFGGYLLTKILGARRGILLTGIAGGLVSSTAVSWVFSKKSKENPELSKNFAAAILLASTIMPLRVILLIYIFNKSLLSVLIIPLVALSIIGLIYAVILAKKNSGYLTEDGIKAENPLDFIEALKFGALFTIIIFFVHFAIQYLGSGGVLLASAVSALTDVDAITISLSKLTETNLTPAIIKNAILLAVLSNSLVKLFITLIFGTRELKKFTAIGFGLMVLAGIAGFIVLIFA